MEEVLQLYRRYGDNTTNHPVNSLEKISIWERYLKSLDEIISSERKVRKRNYNLSKLNSARELLERIKNLQEKTNKDNLQKNLLRMSGVLQSNIRRFEEIEKLFSDSVLRRIIISSLKLFSNKIFIKDFLFINF